MSNLKDFCKEQNLKYTAVQILGLNEKGKKYYKNNIVQLEGIKTMTIEECHKKNEENEKKLNFEANQLYISLENTNFIIIDTDSDLSFKLVKEFLKENDIYDKDYITKSYKGKAKQVAYGRHFWFLMDDDDFFKSIKQQNYKLKNNGFEIGDCFFGSGVVGEWVDVYLDIEDMPIMKKEHFNELVDIMEVKLNFIDDKKPKEIIKKEVVKQKDDEDEILNELDMKNKIDDDLLTKILDNLHSKRCENYEYWLIIAMIFKNENLNYSIFDKFSKKSKKYNKDDNKKIFSNLKKNDKGYTLATLFNFLKEDNYDLFSELNKNRVDIWNLMLTFNHNDLAKLYYNLNTTKYIYCSTKGWYEYLNNNVLRLSGSTPITILNNISNDLQTIILEQRNYLKPTDKKYKEKIKLITICFKQLGNSKFVNCIIDYLKNYYMIYDLYKMIDSNKNLLAFENCVYDFTLNKIRDIKPQDYISKTTGYALSLKSDENIRTELNDILYSIFNNKSMVDYYKYIISSSFFGNKGQNLYIHTGVGSNGKSLLGDFLKSCLGNYYYDSDSNFLCNFKNEGANSSLANCEAKRYISIQEPAGEFFNENFVKLITGQESITCRELYKSNITFPVLFTPHLQCNIKPSIKKADGGITRRIKIIHYPNTFVDEPKLAFQRKKNMNLLNKLKTQKYINEYMLLLLDYINEWKNLNYYEIPKEVEDETNEYIDDNKPLKLYLEKYFDVTNDPKDKIKTSDVFNHYIDNEPNENNLNIKSFNAQMAICGINKKKSDGNMYFIGLKLKNNA